MNEGKRIDDEKLVSFLTNFISKKYAPIETDGVQWSLNVGNCYTTSKIVEKMLRKSGYCSNCKTQRAWMLIGDEIGKEIFIRQSSEKNFDKHEIINAGGWVVGLGYPQSTNWRDENGHWVVHFPESDKLMDLTLGQASRPKHNIRLKPFFGNQKDLPKEVFQVGFLDDDKPIGKLYMDKEPLKSYIENVINEGARRISGML